MNEEQTIVQIVHSNLIFGPIFKKVARNTRKWNQFVQWAVRDVQLIFIGRLFLFQTFINQMEDIYWVIYWVNNPLGYRNLKFSNRSTAV